MKTFAALCAAFLLATSAQAQEVLAQTFYENGRLQSTRFSDGALERFITYYPSGRIQASGTYRDGRREGVWKQFAENGAVLAEASFRAGHRTGVWQFRDGTNVLRGRLTYADGRLAAGEQYEAGELVARRSY